MKRQAIFQNLLPGINVHGQLAEVDALKRLPAETAAELAALLPAVLDGAFQGNL